MNCIHSKKQLYTKELKLINQKGKGKNKMKVISSVTNLKTVWSNAAEDSNSIYIEPDSWLRG